MAIEGSDFSTQLRQRLLVLMQQVERDRAALDSHPSLGIPAEVIAAGDTAYSRLFDSLAATLQNLDSSSADKI